MFDIKMGIPEMEEFWEGLKEKIISNTATTVEVKLYKKLGKAFLQLRYPGLKTHEIEQLSKRYSMKVWQSYVENNTPAAGRFFWVYGPEKGDITIIGMEPHPNDKSNSYKKITLSAMGESL